MNINFGWSCSREIQCIQLETDEFPASSSPGFCSMNPAGVVIRFFPHWILNSRVGKG